MRRVALKSLIHRKTRAILTALAVVLGVSMMSGTYVLTDSIGKAFDDIFSASYQDTSAVISGREIVKGSAGGAPTIPASLLDRVKRQPHVAAAAGAITDLSGNGSSIELLDDGGKALDAKAATFGFGIDTSQPRFNPLKLVDGRWASSDDDVVVDAATAKQHDLDVGDAMRVSGDGPARRFRVAGIARYGSVDSLGGAMIAVFTIPTAQDVLGKEGRLDSISVAAAPGVPQARLVHELRPLLPANVQIQTGQQRAAADAKDTKTFMRFIQYFLLAFAAIALFVGAFVIFNALSITVAQRTREFATLRMIGASRRQIMRSVLLEGALIGTLASAAGLGLGLVLAKGLSALMRALALDLPQGGTVFASRTIVVSLAVGLLITMLATIVPALRATRVAPIAAVAEGTAAPRSRFGRLAPGVSIAVVVLALAALALGSLATGLGTGATLLVLGAGFLALFGGVALVAPRLVRPLAGAIGAPGRRFGGVAGSLASENATRNPGRTASTAAALMIGLALVTVVATLGAGLRHSTRVALTEQVTADYVVTAQNGFGQFSDRIARGIPAVPGVGAASAVLDERAKVLGTEAQVNGVDPATIGRTYDFGAAAGAAAGLDAHGAIVKQSFAKTHHLRRGSRFTLTSPTGRRLAVQVRGTFDPPAFDKLNPVLGSIVVSQRAFTTTFAHPKVKYGFVTLDNGATPDAAATLERALRRFPGVEVKTRDAWVAEQAGATDKLLNLLYVLLALSIVVSLFGMVNTLVLAVFERTRELGLLRTVGMTRRQVRRMVRHESVITALIGAGLGLPIGLLLAGVVTRALSAQGLVFSVPVVSLAAFVAVAVVAGLLAAVLPARRAARLDVLNALQYE
jgi:putative ABC transport system permease protein